MYLDKNIFLSNLTKIGLYVKKFIFTDKKGTNIKIGSPVLFFAIPFFIKSTILLATASYSSKLLGLVICCKFKNK